MLSLFRKYGLKDLVNFLSVPVLIICSFSFVYSLILPDHKSAETALCYAYDAMIITFKCKYEILSFVLNIFHTTLNWVLAILMPFYLPLVILIDFLALIGLIRLSKAGRNLMSR